MAKPHPPVRGPAHKMALSKVTVDDYEKPFYIYTDFDKDLLSVKICNTEGNAWQGTLTLQQLKALADLRNITISMFVQETLEAFSCKSTDHLSFSVKSTDDDAGSLELGWKRLSDGIKFQLGSISLVQAPSQSIHQFLLDQSLDCIAEMKQQVEKLEKTCTELTSQKQEALNSLRNYSVIKETIENELYGKFKHILNEKKAKIRVLMNSKSTLLDQNEEMKRQMRDIQSAQTVDGAKRSMEDTPSPVARTTSTNVEYPSTNVESLLSDPYRPPSPPPTKKRLVSKGKRKGKVEIPQPPPLSSNKQLQDNRDSSPDSNELLDML